MALGFSTELRDARAAQISTVVGANAVIRFYTAPRPATGGTATSVLATLTGIAAFGTVGAGTGVLTVTAAFASSTTAVGTANWFRIFKTGGTVAVIDGTVNTDIIVVNNVFGLNDPIDFVNMTITEGNA